MKYKIVTCVTTYNRLNYISRFYKSWKNTISEDFDHHLIIADDGSTDGTLKFLEGISSNNVTIIKNKRVGVGRQTNTLFDAAKKIDFDFGFKADDDIWFSSNGWDHLYLNAIIKTGYEHLCYLNKKWVDPKRDEFISEFLYSKTSVISCMGCFWTFTKNVINKVGYFDTENFGFMGHEHIDFSMRCCRAGFNDRFNFCDAKDSNKYIDMTGRKDGYSPSLSGDEIKKYNISRSEIERRWRVILDESRIKI